jgi:hypothetical protein
MLFDLTFEAVVRNGLGEDFGARRRGASETKGMPGIAEYRQRFRLTG